MLRNSLTAGLLAIASALAPVALAARFVEQFEVSVTIPAASFFVLPVDPQLLAREQRLNWNLATSTLSPLRAHFDVKNINGGINARLSERAYLSNGRDEIDLNVAFNKVPLSLDSQPVVDDARPGRRVMLEIAAVQGEERFAAGDYHGTVHMIFEAMSP